ncbi:MAG: aminoglycoside adenylyltransferase [Anaerolineales bacterium]|nr:aminoglycoside 6-adenylyltransferase [Anaerolineae bacterium]PWB49765.1 MAG: aminoglycoside adenylyltransferase [Anaerolineales bacterium]
MRSEQEMLDLIITTARNDERVRAVIMNGSRVNPNAPKDFFQDYDVIYVVTEKDSFLANPGWIKMFGELMVLQLPDEMSDPPPDPKDKDSYCYLMQFMDGNRIDLSLLPVGKLDKLEEDSLTLTLLDKDGLLPIYPPPSDSGYIPRPPTAKQYFDCTNEFWWVNPYVAKGLWRWEIVYAKHILDLYMREQLIKMLYWYVGMQTGNKVFPGKMGKYLEKYLEPELWQLLLQTYSDGDYGHTWDALLAMGELFRRIAIPLAEHFGLTYPFGDDERVSAHLLHVRSLPRNAREMY